MVEGSALGRGDQAGAPARELTGDQAAATTPATPWNGLRAAAVRLWIIPSRCRRSGGGARSCRHGCSRAFATRTLASDHRWWDAIHAWDKWPTCDRELGPRIAEHARSSRVVSNRGTFGLPHSTPLEATMLKKLCMLLSSRERADGVGAWRRRRRRRWTRRKRPRRGRRRSG